jgi:hypothetical protein
VCLLLNCTQGLTDLRATVLRNTVNIIEYTGRISSYFANLDGRRQPNAKPTNWADKKIDLRFLRLILPRQRQHQTKSIQPTRAWGPSGRVWFEFV